ncbi:hypothetical protein Rhopal_006012-T1 [Rhodotorula paludigena]|uniref:Mediator of RNA polymerase II transcription subunit 11 n=1 Tax=Rhodotorula paludigena TaxID=86838 RepID=A0AAV5GUD0_9BASI|nr:hypothetical protein Rhopal_006012-T1 [Rhodotorula paludigena]
MQVDEVGDRSVGSPEHDAGDGPQTRAAKRVAELKEVEENIAALLHFAGCTLASLHPDPLSSFTSRELATDDDADDESSAKRAEQAGKEPDKLTEFSKYAEGYYATLNDIQLALRTSIRHLRAARTSAAPLLDPAFASLVAGGAGGGGEVGPGGVARGEALRPLEGGVPVWRSGTERLPREGKREENETERVLSVAALEVERDAWAGLVRSLEEARRE